MYIDELFDIDETSTQAAKPSIDLLYTIAFFYTFLIKRRKNGDAMEIAPPFMALT
jgi:hypothetical protein